MTRSFVLLAAVLTLIGGCANPRKMVGGYPEALDHLRMPTAGYSPSASRADAQNMDGSHTLDYYVQVALKRNPEILAMESRVAGQAEVVPQVTALPDPVLSNTVWPGAPNSPQTASGRMSNNLMVAQQFPWFGKLRLRGEVADLETRIALTQLAETHLKITEAVKASYYEIHFNQEALRITNENERLLRDYIKFAEVRYTAGQTSQQDVLRSQVELNKLQDQLIQLNQQLRMSQADLAKLLSISPEADLKAVKDKDAPPVPDQVDRLYEAAIAARPELQGRLDAIRRDERMVELAKLQYYPDITVGVNWGAITTNDALAKTATGNDNVGLIVAMNLPVWHNKLSAGVRQNQNRTVESAKLYDAARDETFRQIKRYTIQAHSLEQQISLFRKDIIPRADQTLNVSAADYRTGKVVMLQLIDNWTQLLRFQIQLARLEAALAQTIASLERVVGTELTPLPMSRPQEKKMDMPMSQAPTKIRPGADGSSGAQTLIPTQARMGAPEPADRRSVTFRRSYPE